MTYDHVNQLNLPLRDKKPLDLIDNQNKRKSIIDL